MKQGWNKKPVGDICKILNGFAFKSNEYVEDGVRVMRITNVQKGYIVDDDPQFFPINRENEISKYMLSDGDLLMSLTGNVGRVGVLTSEFLPAALNQRVACLRIKESTGVNLKYLFHIFNSKTFEDDCIINATGIAQKNMSTKWLENYLIPVPPIAEQEKIVAELDCLSGIIEKKKQQLKELDALAQSIFYEMFGDPVENDKGWEMKRLGDISQSQIGITYKPENVSDDNGTIVLRSGNIQESALCFNDIVRVNCDIKEHKYVQKGDILMCSRNGSHRLVGKVAMIPELSEKMTYGAFMTIIRSDFQSYLFAFFKTPAFRSQLTSAQTATINQITVKMLNEIIVALPPLSLQQDFASKIESIEKQKELIAQSIKETETLFNSRMDYYFN